MSCSGSVWIAELRPLSFSAAKSQHGRLIATRQPTKSTGSSQHQTLASNSAACTQSSSDVTMTSQSHFRLLSLTSKLNMARPLAVPVIDSRESILFRRDRGLCWFTGDLQTSARKRGSHQRLPLNSGIFLRNLPNSLFKHLTRDGGANIIHNCQKREQGREFLSF